MPISRFTSNALALISIREYERLHIGEFDASRSSVTREQAELLTGLKSVYGFDVFKFVNGRTLAAQQYVGIYQFGAHTIEVLPKVDSDENNIRRNLVAMLSESFGLEVSDGDVARVASQNHGILEILIRLFCDKLFLQVHRGLIRRYENREENLTVLRGRLAVVEQIRRNAFNPERLFCRFDEFQEDNPLNQILKAALRILLGAAKTPHNQRQLAQLLLVFDEVSDIHKASLPWNRVVFDRLSSRYKPCYLFAEFFLKNCNPDVTAGRLHGFSLFFDMNVLFEEYIGRKLQQIFRSSNIRVTLQRPQKHLAIREQGEQPCFVMKPDVVATHGGAVQWILDTKWKQLTGEDARNGIAQADMYQMYAYANCYDCNEVILLYPHHGELSKNPGIMDAYLMKGHAISDLQRRIKVGTVDLSDLKTVTSQLSKILGVEVEYQESQMA